jgi:hypothetical protein
METTRTNWTTTPGGRGRLLRVHQVAERLAVSTSTAYDYVGGAVLDLNDVRPLEVFPLPSDADHLVVRLNENTTLNLVGPQQELPE